MELVKEEVKLDPTVDMNRQAIVDQFQEMITKAIHPVEPDPDIANNTVPVPSPVADPVISESDRQLIAKASRSLNNLKIEMKTILAFTSDYLVEKYGIKDQDQFDRVVGII